MLVEKLLRSCPDIGNIYLLVRSKNQNNTSERLEILLNSKVSLKKKLKNQIKSQFTFKFLI